MTEFRSWRPEVQTERGGEFATNGLRFATEDEARQWAYGLSMRWTGMLDFRVTQSEDEPNYVMLPTGNIKRIGVDDDQGG